jgi:hypothetical protein
MPNIPLYISFHVLRVFKSSPFKVDFGNKKMSGGDTSGEYGGDLILESLLLPKTAILVLQYEVSRCRAKGTSSLDPETEILLDELFEPNEIILPVPSPEESFDDQLK